MKIKYFNQNGRQIRYKKGNTCQKQNIGYRVKETDQIKKHQNTQILSTGKRNMFGDGEIDIELRAFLIYRAFLKYTWNIYIAH